MHNLPHIIFVNNKKGSWKAAIRWALENEWKNHWNSEIDKYRWDRLILILERLITRHIKK